MDPLSDLSAAPGRDPRTATALQTGASVALLATTFGVLGVFVPQLGSIPRDAWLLVAPMAVFSASAALISAGVLWRARHRVGTPEVALAMALLAVANALSIVPWGDASTTHKALFGIAWGLMFLQFLHFWARFPRRMTREGTLELARRTGRGPWLDPALRWTARVAHVSMWTWPGRAFLVLGAAAMSWAIVGEAPAPYALLTPKGARITGVSGVLSSVLMYAVFVVNAFVITSSYRLADETGRRKVLWILLAHLITTIVIFFALAVSLAQAMTGSTLLAWLGQVMRAAFLPLTNVLFLGGYALGVFQSGAFDLRPLIGRSTVAGASLMSLTFIFAGVENLAQSFVVSSVGLPEGAATWIGAVAVAALLGPVQDRMARLLKSATKASAREGAATPERGGTAEEPASREPAAT